MIARYCGGCGKYSDDYQLEADDIQEAGCNICGETYILEEKDVECERCVKCHKITPKDEGKIFPDEYFICNDCIDSAQQLIDDNISYLEVTRTGRRFRK